ncbi:MAG: amino acid permease [Acidobacteria bacterium]|nr:amino acid permease [Acidobacteriota bacterium]
MSGAHLRKTMGFWDIVFFYVVTTLSLRWIATAAAAGPSSIVIWIVACLTFLIPLVFCVLELSSRYPDEGGMYAWSKRAFGESSGFMTGWLYWASNLPYYPGLLYFAAGNALFIGGDAWQHLSENSTYFILVSLGGLLLAIVLNVIGLDIGKWLHNIGAIGGWIPALILIAMGGIAWSRFGSATDFSAAALLPSTSFKDVLFWSTISFAFGGFEGASFMGEEIRNARRNVPIAVVFAGILITITYIGATASVLWALPASEVSGLQGVMQAISKVGERIGVGAIIPFTALLVALSGIGGVSAWFAAASRLPFVAGLDRFLPPAFGKLHPKWKTPYIALTVQGAIAAVFVFFGQAGTTVKGAYDVLVSMSIISYFLPFLYMFSAMIRVQREPAGPDVMRVPGGPVVAKLMAVVGLMTTVISIVLAVVPPADEPNKVLAVTKVVGLSVLTVAIGAGIYMKARSRSSAGPSTFGDDAKHNRK